MNAALLIIFALLALAIYLGIRLFALPSGAGPDGMQSIDLFGGRDLRPLQKRRQPRFQRIEF